MPELNPRDRLQPFLLDRLTDDQPEVTKESREKNVFSPRQLREALLRDLSWLLNTPAPVEGDGISEFPQVVSSVLNFGVPDLTGTTASNLAGSALERNVMKAIEKFEPRIDRHSLSVHLVTAENQPIAAGNMVSLEIRGEIIANQLAEPLYIRTEVDLETGQFGMRT